MAELRVTRVALQVAGFQEASSKVIPDSPGTIFSTLYRNNWVSNVSMERAWQTDISQSTSSSAEERWALRRRPLTSQRIQLTGMDQNASANLLIHLARQVQHGTPCPIYADRTRLTQAYSSGTRLYCDTSYRRFFLGQRIAVVQKGWGVVQVTGAYAPVEYATIKAVDPTFIDIDDPLVASLGYNVGSYVFPLFDAEPVLRVEYDRVTRQIIDGTITWIEKSGIMTLPSLLSSPHVPAPTWSYAPDGLPILEAKMNGNIRGSVQRAGTRYSSGRGSVVDLAGEIGRFGISAEFKVITRADWWYLASFFDLARGSCYPFWFVNPQRLWELDSVQSNTVFRVKRTHYYHVFDPTISQSSDGKPPWLNNFALVENDGRIHIRSIVSVAEVSKDLWDITISSSVPTGDIRRITAAHKARLVDDVFKDTWYTFDVASANLSMLEVVNEQDVVITGLS